MSIFSPTVTKKGFTEFCTLTQNLSQKHNFRGPHMKQKERKVAHFTILVGQVAVNSSLLTPRTTRPLLAFSTLPILAPSSSRLPSMTTTAPAARQASSRATLCSVTITPRPTQREQAPLERIDGSYSLRSAGADHCNFRGRVKVEWGARHIEGPLHGHHAALVTLNHT